MGTPQQLFALVNVSVVIFISTLENIYTVFVTLEPVFVRLVSI